MNIATFNGIPLWNVVKELLEIINKKAGKIVYLKNKYYFQMKNINKNSRINILNSIESVWKRETNVLSEIIVDLNGSCFEEQIVFFEYLLYYNYRDIINDFKAQRKDEDNEQIKEKRELKKNKKIEKKTKEKIKLKRKRLYETLKLEFEEEEEGN